VLQQAIRAADYERPGRARRLCGGKAASAPGVRLLADARSQISRSAAGRSAACKGVAVVPPPGKTIHVRDLAFAPPGDKGNHANIGVVANDEAAYGVLCSRLTAVRVQTHFQELGVSRVERYELPNVLAFNFVLYDVLGGGASRSLRIDTQGKLLATSLL